mgnify:CR=1 FL=1
MQFTRVSVQGFRSLVDVDLPLRPLGVMIGPNGCGKTALLEVFLLLRGAAQRKLAQTLDGLGGVHAVLSRLPVAPEGIGIGLMVVDADRSLRYRFVLVPRPVGYAIREERLEQALDGEGTGALRYIDAQYDRLRYASDESPGGFVPTWTLDPQELALAQAPPMLGQVETLRSALTKVEHLSGLDVGPQAPVRLPQGLTPAVRPGPNGEGLFSALHNLRSMRRDVYAQVEDVLRIGFPGFERLEFQVVGMGQVTLAWHQEGLAGPLYPAQLSEGTLRFLWLATALLAPEPPPLLLLDEPEVSLHPELIKLLAGLLQDASVRGQVLVATHSPDLVRWLQPDQVLVLDKEANQTRPTWADSLDLDAWLEEYTLRDLWLMGTLGGRP